MSRAARIRSILGYDKDTGVFVWLVSKGKCKAGSVAGTSNTTGHVQISVDGKKYLAHRLAWLCVTGEWPTQEIDHINGVRSDNRFANLRQASRSQNAQNARLRRDNTSGRKGVTWCKNNLKWKAEIAVNFKRIRLGYFNSLDAASEAYNAAADAYHGDFSVIKSRGVAA